MKRGKGSLFSTVVYISLPLTFMPPFLKVQIPPVADQGKGPLLFGRKYGPRTGSNLISVSLGAKGLGDDGAGDKSWSLALNRNLQTDVLRSQKTSATIAATVLLGNLSRRSWARDSNRRSNVSLLVAFDAIAAVMASYQTSKQEFSAPNTELA